MLESVVVQVINPVNLCLFALTLTLVYAIRSWLFHPSEYPPMPCTPVPLLGHITFMKPTPLKAFTKWKKQLGDLFTIYVAGKPTIVICNHDLLIEAFVKQADSFSDRPLSARAKIVQNRSIPISAGIVLTSNGLWKEQRSVTLSILRSFGMSKNIMADRISQEVDTYLNELSAKKGEATDVRVLINLAISNVICAVLLGERFDYEDPVFVRLVKQNEDILQLVGPSSLLNIFPWLRFLPGDLFDAKQLAKSFRELNEIFSNHFVKKFKDSADDGADDNFIKAYLREMKKRQASDQSTYLDEQNLVRTIDNLFVAGTETTGTTILWAMVFAMRWPQFQEKVYKEIEEMIGTERLPTIQDKRKLNFLNTFIMETQRLGSIAPLGIPHMCSRTTELGGYTIPKGATVISHLDAVLKDPMTWKDPEAFKPERFLDKDNNLITTSHFMPFSLGRRVCLGESLAKMELFLFLGAMFQRFEILPESPGSPPSMESVFGITMAPKPFKVRFKPRQ